jgi:prepilin signal peptidase PulO-like enzyme (type II secretory pathway)
VNNLPWDNAESFWVFAGWPLAWIIATSVFFTAVSLPFLWRLKGSPHSANGNVAAPAHPYRELISRDFLLKLLAAYFLSCLLISLRPSPTSIFAPLSFMGFAFIWGGVLLAMIDAHTAMLPKCLTYLVLGLEICAVAQVTFTKAFDKLYPTPIADGGVPPGQIPLSWRQVFEPAANSIMSALLAVAILGFIWRVGKKHGKTNTPPMGFGDVRLAGVIGLPLGLNQVTGSMPSIVIALLIGSLIGVATGALRLRKARRAGKNLSAHPKDVSFPFGPSLVIGAILTQTLVQLLQLF